MINTWQKKRNIWQKKKVILVLERTTRDIIFISLRELSIRENNQILGCTHNGICLGIVEIITYYTFLKDYIENYENVFNHIISHTN